MKQWTKEDKYKVLESIVIQGEEVMFEFINALQDLTPKMGKVCTKCNERKISQDFNKRQASKDGLAYVCKFCEAGYREEQKIKDVEYDNDLHSINQLTPEQRAFLEDALTKEINNER